MGVIMVVCAAFDLTVSEAKTEIVCIRTNGMLESTAIFSKEAPGRVYNQTNEFVNLRVNTNHNERRRVHRGRPGAYATHGAASGSTPSNCTINQALPSSSKFGC